MRKFSFYSLVLLFPLLACAGVYRHDVPVKLYKIFAAQEQFNCAGEVFLEPMNIGTPSGSCVLIGNKYVLTAAHIFLKSDTEIDTQYIVNGQKITTYKQVNIRFGDAKEYSFRFKRKMYKGKEIIIHPAYHDKKSRGPWCDLAIIKLEDEVRDVLPAVLNTTFDELYRRVTGVGFGSSGKADTPEEVGVFMEKIAGQNIIDTIYGKEWEGNATILAADFDHPFNTTCNKTGSPEPLLLEYTVSGGDSGGPLFVEALDGWKLIGICSGGGVELEQFLKTGYYGQTASWTRVATYRKWINEMIMKMNES